MTTKVKKTAYSKKVQPAIKKKMKNAGPRCRAKGGVYNNKSGACIIKDEKGSRKKSKAQTILSISF